MPCAPAASYDCAMTIPADLDRARQLIFAADEEAAKDLLLSLGGADRGGRPRRFDAGGFAQLGELYLVRTAYDGVREAIRRIDDCLAIYRSIRVGHESDAAAQVTMSDAEIDHMRVPVLAPGPVPSGWPGRRRARRPRGCRAGGGPQVTATGSPRSTMRCRRRDRAADRGRTGLLRRRHLRLGCGRTAHTSCRSVECACPRGRSARHAMWCGRRASCPTTSASFSPSLARGIASRRLRTRRRSGSRCPR